MFFLKRKIVQHILKEDVDLECLKKRPTTQVKIGITLVLTSYVVGWPIVALLGFIAFSLDEVLIVIIGGPLVYGLSHLVFLLGMYLAGREYATVLLKWSMKATIEKIFGIHGKNSESIFNIDNQP
jgi:hypothetical protein